MKKYNTLITYYLLILLGLIMTSWIIWARFLRERIIRDIPDPFLTEYRFWILFYICLIYLYIIKNYLKPKEPNIFFSMLSNRFFMPLFTCDNLKIFTKEEIIIPKWADSYVKTHLNLRKSALEWDDLFNNPQQKYNPNGITRERVLKLCQAYDFILYKKYPHPVTYDQELATEKNTRNNLLKETNNKTTHGSEKDKE